MAAHNHPEILHKSKKWEEYFKEFLMIFLAVTLGFLSENFREHIANRDKEKQYIVGFIRNVKEDTVFLHHVIEFDKQLVKGLDSMLELSHLNMVIDSNRKSFYYFSFRYLLNSSSFRSNDATLQQLKSTGDFRLIEKDHVTDSLAKYDANIHDIYKQGDYYQTYFKEILFRLDDLMDMTILADFVKNGKIMTKPLPQLRNGSEKLPTLFNKIFIFRSITTAYAESNLKPQLENSRSLIAFLKKEYDIQD